MHAAALIFFLVTGFCLVHCQRGTVGNGNEPSSYTACNCTLEIKCYCRADLFVDNIKVKVRVKVMPASPEQLDTVKFYGRWGNRSRFSKWMTVAEGNSFQLNDVIQGTRISLNAEMLETNSSQNQVSACLKVKAGEAENPSSDIKPAKPENRGNGESKTKLCFTLKKKSNSNGKNFNNAKPEPKTAFPGTRTNHKLSNKKFSNTTTGNSSKRLAGTISNGQGLLLPSVVSEGQGRSVSGLIPDGKDPLSSGGQTGLVSELIKNGHSELLFKFLERSSNRRVGAPPGFPNGLIGPDPGFPANGRVGAPPGFPNGLIGQDPGLPATGRVGAPPGFPNGQIRPVSGFLTNGRFGPIPGFSNAQAKLLPGLKGIFNEPNKFLRRISAARTHNSFGASPYGQGYSADNRFNHHGGGTCHHHAHAPTPTTAPTRQAHPPCPYSH